jgi:hypothetical protein
MTGTTVALVEKGGDTFVVLDHPAAPADLRNAEVGRMVEGTLQVPFVEFGLSPLTLRAIADLIEENGDV